MLIEFFAHLCVNQMLLHIKGKNSSNLELYFSMKFGHLNCILSHEDCFAISPEIAPSRFCTRLTITHRNVEIFRYFRLQKKAC